MASQLADSSDFARAFGDALVRFLRERDLSQSDASKRLGLGRSGKARLNTYCHDSPKGRRPKPAAEVLYLVCTELGFEFEYKGYRITAAALNGSRPEPVEKVPEQLMLQFSGQFNLTDQKGTVSVKFNRPPGRVKMSIHLEQAS